MEDKKYTFIDLFAGCGGLSEGFLETGKFTGLAHVEWETPMVNTLRQRLMDKWGHSKDETKKRVIKFDIQKTDELIHGNWSDETKKIYGKENHEDVISKGLCGLIGNENVDLVIGGPPCQAYSIAGRVRSENGMKDDYRNYLFESFVKVVDFFKPKMFVFENVMGILSACPNDEPILERIYESFQNIGYDIRKPHDMKLSVYNSDDFGVPQKRRRVIIIGVKNDVDFTFDDIYQSIDNHKIKTPHKTVKDAIGNLPKLYPLETPYKNGRQNISHHQVDTDNRNVIWHVPRYHSKRDQSIFKEWIEKNMNKSPKQEQIDFYYKKTGHTTNFMRYRNLEWDKPSPTIVAHLKTDGYTFIHPDPNQSRSITVREAALLQSFPMDYNFIGSMGYCFKMIGNAVPVLLAKNIAESVYDVLIQKKLF